MSSLPVDAVYLIRSSSMKFGIGVTSEVGYDLKKLKVSKVLIVTDKFINEGTKIPEIVKESAEERGIRVDIWDGVEPEPSLQSVKEGIEFAKNKGYDGFIGLGGGSSIDTAKAIDLFTTYPADFYDYLAKPIGKGMDVPGPIKPLIAIPTTAGTGSETSPVCVISLPELKTKSGISNDALRPTLAILDPLNTITMPPKVTASTGMDALMHAIEAYTSKPYDTKVKPATPLERPVYVGSNPVTDLLAEKAIKLIGKYLRRAFLNGYDIEARSNMLLASFLAGVAFTNAGVHIPHAMSFPIGGRVPVPHGIAAGICGPACFTFTASSLPEKHAYIAQLLGEKIEGLSTIEAGLKVSEALIKLMKDLDFPNGLNALGFSEKDVPELAEGTLKIQRLLLQSPRIISKQILEQILYKALRYW
ncbi:MAG: hydroxyacid-oxoacid transhydrogenase [Candidatus Methanomethylicaceae archaeon]